MALKKLTDKEKIERISARISRALHQSKYNENRIEVLGYCVATLADCYAIIQADKDDNQAITFVGAEVLAEVTKREKVEHFPAEGTQLQLGETMGVLDEQKSADAAKKPGK